MRANFTLKVLTPMFMGGADPEGDPELRAASIRGAMRFWFRAIAGAITNDPREIYRLESEVFGNTERKSRVVVRVKYSQPYKKSSLLIKPEDPTKNKRAKPLPLSLAYLANMGLIRYFGKKELPKDIDKSRRGFYWGRFGFSDKFKFRVEFQSNSGEILDIAAKTFKIAAYIGGFGTRWRHGFGSCQIDVSSGKPAVIDLDNTVAELRELITELARSLKIEVNRRIKSFPDFPIFHPDYVEVWEGTLPCPNNAWETCLDNIGEIYREFRINGEDRTHTKDYLDLIEPIFKGEIQKLKNSKKDLDFTNDIFGLPLPFRSRTYNRSATLNISNRKKKIGRRASPLILHVEPKDRLVRATLFISKFIPDDAKYFVDRAPYLKLERPNEKDFDRIRDFLRNSLGLTRRYPHV